MRVVDTASQIGKRSADIRSDNPEHRPRGRREQTDLKIAIEKQHRDFRAVHGVTQIVGGDSLMLDGFAQLSVEGGELLVERLQLFLRGFQFFVARLKLLVDRHGLFVGGRQLVIGCLQVTDCALQFLAGGVELLLELGDMRRIDGFAHGFAAIAVLGSIREAHQKKLLAVRVNRLDPDAHRHGLAVTVHLRVCVRGARRFPP